MQIYNDPFIMLILGAIFAVDTFFLIAGFLVSYLTFQRVDKRGLIIPMAIIHRYIRLILRKVENQSSHDLINLVLITDLLQLMPS
jgi:hypothetical protein